MVFLRRFWLLLAISQPFSQASSAPGVVEVDLIFSRNDTFAPSKLTPIVFAIQNPSLVQSINPVLSWNIEQRGVSANDSINTSDLFHLSSLNYSNSDPYFLYESTGHLDSEGFFQFAWTIEYSNCPLSPGELPGRQKCSFWNAITGRWSMANRDCWMARLHSCMTLLYLSL
jgi:hypothetical protein